MKLFICSDLHGSAYYCKKMLEAYKKERADKLLFLGDILYHGPRNDLPKDYAPKEVCKMLNEIKNELLCVKGNCEAEVDQMVLEFPVMASYCFVNIDGLNILATHGDLINEKNCTMLKNKDILLHGHTHIPACAEFENFIYLNPGSISIPKENNPHSYMVYEKRTFVWKDDEGKEYKQFSF